jgi:hypothetical protein
MSYSYDTSHNSPNYTPQASSTAVFGYNRTIEGITIHWWGDPNQNPLYEGVRDYLDRINGNTSAHYVATGTGRRVSCIVSPMDVAWHSGSAYGNAKTIGVECDPRARDEDYDVISELIADIRSAYGDVPLYSHNMWTGTTCPGVYDIVRLDNMSYTKQSNADWGSVTNKSTTPPPITPPSQPAPSAPVSSLLYKVSKDGKQIGAFAKDINAWNCYMNNSATVITINGTDITSNLRSKFTAPSPTTTDNSGQTLPDSGKPVTEKDDYTEILDTVKANNTLLNQLVSWFKKIFNIQ